MKKKSTTAWILEWAGQKKEFLCTQCHTSDR